MNLDSYRDICYDKVESFDKFYKLLTIDNKEELDSVIKDEALLKNYSNKLIDLSSKKDYEEDIMDEIIEINVAKQTGYLEGLEEGREVGLEEGILANQKEIVINMYNDGVEPETISKYTKLNIEEVQRIIQEKK